MAALITVAEDTSFNNWADFGHHDPAMNGHHDPAMNQPTISGLSSLGASMAQFDQPIAQTPAFGSYATNPPPFSPAPFDAKAYWSQSVMPAAAALEAPKADLAAAAVKGLDAIGNMFGGGEPKVEIPKAVESEVNLGSLSSAINGLGRADRYREELTAQTQQRRPGARNDYS